MMHTTTAHRAQPHAYIQLHPRVQQLIFILTILLSLLPFVSSAMALLAGVVIANTIGNPFARFSGRATKILLQLSVVGLGFGMNAERAFAAGREGLLLTIGSITFVLAMGYVLGRMLKINRNISGLISAGTAICGGSAIAAVAPVINADEKQTSMALGVVFLLNALALLMFPAIGHYFRLSQDQFGLWCALAIHDTSSVVGAAARYGDRALEVATMVKLARALWIVPVSLGFAFRFRAGHSKISIPWFIGFFLLAMLLHTYVPQTASVAPYLVKLAKTALNFTLLLIGSDLSVTALKNVGGKALLQGLVLWVAVGAATLAAIMWF